MPPMPAASLASDGEAQVPGVQFKQHEPDQGHQIPYLSKFKRSVVKEVEPSEKQLKYIKGLSLTLGYKYNELMANIKTMSQAGTLITELLDEQKKDAQEARKKPSGS